MSEDRDDEVGVEDFRPPTEAPLPARARAVEHLHKLLAGATATLAMAGCSSPDRSGAPPTSAAPASSASPSGTAELPIAPSGSASAAPSAVPEIVDAGDGKVDAGAVDAGQPDAGKPVPKARHRQSSGYEVVDMLPPPPFYFRRKKKKTNPSKPRS
jgi:hypothetical protein